MDDDYCDCADASDEPNTGACPGSTLQCENKLHKPTTVFASRVNDGVCDCCDGGDEPASPGLCKNTCIDLARAAFSHLEAACKIKSGRQLAGKAAASKREGDLENARANLAASRPELARAQREKEAAEAEEAEELMHGLDGRGAPQMEGLRGRDLKEVGGEVALLGKAVATHRMQHLASVVISMHAVALATKARTALEPVSYVY